MRNGQLKVWWKPQIPMRSFEVLVDNLKEAHLLINTLADYDLFQYETGVKPDYFNVGGLVMWDENLEPDDDGSQWTDWVDELSGDDFTEYTEKFFKAE